MVDRSHGGATPSDTIFRLLFRKIENGEREREREREIERERETI